MTDVLTDWQVDQIGCTCPIHRYHVAHICACGELLSHSQDDWNRHREHQMISFDSKWVKHGDTAKQVLDRLAILGVLPYGTVALDAVWNHFGDQ